MLHSYVAYSMPYTLNLTIIYGEVMALECCQTEEPVLHSTQLLGPKLGLPTPKFTTINKQKAFLGGNWRMNFDPLSHGRCQNHVIILAYSRSACRALSDRPIKSKNCDYFFETCDYFDNHNIWSKIFVIRKIITSLDFL